MPEQVQGVGFASDQIRERTWLDGMGSPSVCSGGSIPNNKFEKARGSEVPTNGITAQIVVTWGLHPSGQT